MTQDFEKNMSDEEIISVISKRQKFAGVSMFIVILGYLGIIICPVLLLLSWGRNIVEQIIFMILTVASVLICVFLRKRVGNVEAEIKELTGQYVVKGVLAEKIDIVEYFPNRYINEKFVKKCSILPKYNKINGSDYISGNYRGRKIIYSDLLLQWVSRERDRDGHLRKKTTTRFRGPIMKMELGKDIEGVVRIMEKKNPGMDNGFLSNIIEAENIHNSIETENVTFNNQFEIRTSNGQLAFYILTPQFMEAVMRLDELANGYTNIEFRDSSVVIALNNGKDSFKVNKKLKSLKLLEKYRQSFRKELEIILGVLDEVLTKENLF